MDDRELDALVAEKVMGWEPWCVQVKGSVLGARVQGYDPERLDYWLDGGTKRPCGWSPSTDIAAAWEVVEKMRERSDGHFTLLGFTTNWRAGWRTPYDEDIDPARRAPCDEYGFSDFTAAATAPRAICLAALKHVGELAEAPCAACDGRGAHFADLHLVECAVCEGSGRRMVVGDDPVCVDEGAAAAAGDV